MKFAKRLLVIFGAVALAGTLAALFAPKTAHGLVSTLVTVVNTAPVPTNVVNTPSVDVNSLPAVQIGGGTLNAAVGNAIGGTGLRVPLLVAPLVGTDTFNVDLGCTFDGGSGVCTTALYTVQDNQTAVLQSLNGNCSFESDQKGAITYVLVSSASGGPLTAVLPNGSPFPVYVTPGTIQFFGQNITAYASGRAGGNAISGTVFLTANAAYPGAVVCDLRLAGYLIPTQ